ncbi:MAG: MBL fold metallo-hydrolase [Candidatus Diapherotrites archaeon]|nr:MBL fold metallo-hydrolase [Candidatus Diapherotrites archaeon]
MFEVQYIYHSFFRVKMGGKVLLIDPYFDSKAPEGGMKKIMECPMKVKQFMNADAILVSHEHFDHFDKKAIEEIAGQSGCAVIAHDDLLASLNVNHRQKKSIDLKRKINFGGVEIEPLPAHHPNSFYPMGFRLESNGDSLVHTGDTDLTGIFAKLKADVLCVPIGGAITMDLVDAVRAVKTMEPKYAIPMHYNTFDVIKCRPGEFKEKIEKSILNTEAVVLKPGRTLKI